MAVRTMRARMLYKLVYLLGPKVEIYMEEDGRKPYTFSEALEQTLRIFGRGRWGFDAALLAKAKEQLEQDYANLMDSISDDNM